MNNYFIYNEDREYVGATRFAEDAAALVAVLGDGTRISSQPPVNHRKGSRYDWKKFVVWLEGSETQSASESYDHVAEVVQQRQRSGNYV